MKRILTIALTVGIASATLVTLHAQQQHADHQAPPARPKASAEAPEVFCSTMKTGQLCSHGTTSALGLDGEKRDAWLAAVRKYNKAVNEATMQLKAEANGVLSAVQLAEVDRWFAVGMNLQMNQLLAVPSGAKAAPAKGATR